MRFPHEFDNHRMNGSRSGRLQEPRATFYIRTGGVTGDPSVGVALVDPHNLDLYRIYRLFEAYCHIYQSQSMLRLLRVDDFDPF